MPQATATRPAVVPRPQWSNRKNGYAGTRPRVPAPGQAPRRPGSAGPKPADKQAGASRARGADKPEHEILFQQYFKSVNPQRTYAAQVKKANNGNHYLVLTEGKRDDSTGEIRKTRLFLFGEDFMDFFRMLQATAQFIRANPVPDEVKKKRDRLWAKKVGAAPSS